MRLPRQKNKKKLIITSVATLIMAVAIVGYFALYHNPRTAIKPESTPRSQDEVNNPYDQSNLKQNLPERSAEEVQNPNPPSVDPTYSIKLSDFTQSNGTVSIRSIVDAPSKGICRYTFVIEAAKPVTREAPSIGSDGPKYCNIDIPEVEFERVGVWKMTIGFTGAGKTNEIHQNVTIN